MQGDPGDPVYCAVSSSCWRGGGGGKLQGSGKLDAQEDEDGASIQKEVSYSTEGEKRKKDSPTRMP